MGNLPQPGLILVTDRRRAPGGDLVAAVEAAVRGGAGIVILRERDLPAGELLPLAARLRAAIRGRALFLVNDRVDVALACRADGAHLGEDGSPTPAVRALARARRRFLIGRSVHRAAAAVRAAEDGADYLLVGTMFPTPSHPGKPPEGPGLLSLIAARAALPLYAIGGITAANAGECLRAGAAGVAVISAVLGAPDPEAAARELSAALREAQSRER